jgi:hypothetical protein
VRGLRGTAGLSAAVALLLLPLGASEAYGASDSIRLVTVSDLRIDESSGLAASPSRPGIVWTVNDSGDSARAFAVSLKTGRTVAVLSERTDARDCEAMTSGRDSRGRAMLWIGDIGDNRAVRPSVVLRLIHEPDPIRSVTVTPVDVRVRYPGGPADAESLIWTPTGRLLIVTKGLLGGDVLEVPPAAVAAALDGRSVATPALARKVGHVSQVFPDDGVALPDGRLVIRDYAGATVYAPPAYDGKALVEQARVAFPQQRQGETMAVVDSGRAVVVGSEGSRQALWKVALPAAPKSSPVAGAETGNASPIQGSGSWTGLLVGAALILLALLAVSWLGYQLYAGRRRGAARQR